MKRSEADLNSDATTIVVAEELKLLRLSKRGFRTIDPNVVRTEEDGNLKYMQGLRDRVYSEW